MDSFYNNNGKRPHHDFLDDASLSEGSSSAPSNMTKSGKPKRKRKPLDKNSDEYKKRREKNNEAVKKSRIKSKIKTEETKEQVNELSHENELLTQKVQSLKKEFELLKELYQAHSKDPNDPSNAIDLTSLMAPEEEGDDETITTATRGKGGKSSGKGKR